MSVRKALDLYRTFQAKDPDLVAALDDGITFPSAFGAVGRAVGVFYESSKWRTDGGATGFHHTYESAVDFCEPWRDGLRPVDSPETPMALVLLGRCAAVEVVHDDGTEDFAMPPDGTLLTATPDGRALVLVHERLGVLGALIGGSQRITESGIEG